MSEYVGHLETGYTMAAPGGTTMSIFAAAPAGTFLNHFRAAPVGPSYTGGPQWFIGVGLLACGTFIRLYFDDGPRWYSSRERLCIVHV